MPQDHDVSRNELVSLLCPVLYSISTSTIKRVLYNDGACSSQLAIRAVVARGRAPHVTSCHVLARLGAWTPPHTGGARAHGTSPRARRTTMPGPPPSSLVYSPLHARFLVLGYLGSTTPFSY